MGARDQGVLVLGESITVIVLVGIALVLAGVACLNTPTPETSRRRAPGGWHLTSQDGGSIVL